MSDPITLPAPVIDLTTAHRTKWEREHQAFRQLLPQLLVTHRGRYVAIHEGQVVDSNERAGGFIPPGQARRLV